MKRKLEEVTLSSSLQSLTFLDNFGQSLKGVTLPSSLHSLTFGNGFGRSLERVTLPSNLRSLACGEFFNHSLEHVMLPSSLRRLVFFIRFFNRPLQRVTSALSSLESVTVGISLKRVLEGVAPPNSLQSLSCAWGVFLSGKHLIQVSIVSSVPVPKSKFCKQSLRLAVGTSIV